MMSGKLKRDRKAVVSVAGAAVALLLGVGLAPASAAVGPAAAVQAAVPTATQIVGFDHNPASVRLGGQLSDTVSVSPKAARTVSVQYRRAGTTAFTTAYSTKTSAQGSVTAFLMPRSAGTWQFRLSVPATSASKAVVSPVRTVKASGRAVATKIGYFVSTPTTVKAGATIKDLVRVSPNASRLVEVQARRSGATTWVKTSASGRSTTAGAFMAVYRPTAGVWRYRLVVKASTTARTAVSATRTVTVAGPKDTTAPRPVTGLRVATGSSTGTSVALHWLNPTNADFTGVMIRRAIGAIAPATAKSGTLVTDLIDDVPYVVDVKNVIPGTEYSYAVFAHDAANNYAAAAKVTFTTANVTASVLTVDSTKVTVGGELFFDASLSHAALASQTLTAVSLNHGDGTPATTFAPADQSSWFEAHTYTKAGTYTATLTVTDSVGVIKTSTKVITVYAAPTAAITVAGQSTATTTVGTSVTFTLDYSTAGAKLQSWTKYSDVLAGGFGTVPPATLAETFTAPGTYPVKFTIITDGGAEVSSTVVVTVT